MSKKIKLQQTAVKLEMFDASVIFCISSRNDFEDWLVKEKNIMAFQLGTAEQAASTLTNLHDDSVIVWLNTFKKLDSRVLQCLVHELVHASHHIQNIIGPIFNGDTQETQAYMVDYLFRKFCEWRKFR